MDVSLVNTTHAPNVNKSLTGRSKTERMVSEISHSILDVIFEYALNKFDDSRERLERGASTFLSVISEFVACESQVKACLPAFPFKSANKVYKVLGSLPDRAEELALGRLNTMCTRIREIYPPGAQVTIISDGITYNDLLCISDQDTWAYGEALREMATRKGFSYIQFSRMRDILDFPLPEKMTEIIYVANCTSFRRLLLNQYGRGDLDIDNEIATNPDTKLTYLGYKRFLESDLKHIFPRGANRTANEYRRDCKYLAKQMLIRGDAFGRAIKSAFPNYLRLSIHESVSDNKLSICLLNTKTGFTTPWHCSVAKLVDGEWISAPMAEFSKDGRFVLIYEDGRPSYFEEKPCETGRLDDEKDLVNHFQGARPRKAIEYFTKGYSLPQTGS